MQPPKLNCDQHVCVLRPQWIGTIWLWPLPLTWVPDSLVCKEAQHRPVKPLHTWPHGHNLARSVRGQITHSRYPYPKGCTQVYVSPHPYVQYCAWCCHCLFIYIFVCLLCFVFSFLNRVTDVLLQSLTVHTWWPFNTV